MRRFLVFIFLILISCERDDLLEIPPVSKETTIFEDNETLIKDGQLIYFNTPSSETYSLLIIDPSSHSVISKESFTSTLGINQRSIYTRVLPKQKLKLVLLKGSEEINSTFIIVE